jgi:hypothetical protein
LRKISCKPASLLRRAFMRTTADSAVAEPPTCTRNIHIIRRNHDVCQVNSRQNIYLDIDLPVFEGHKEAAHACHLANDSAAVQDALWCCCAYSKRKL